MKDSRRVSVSTTTGHPYEAASQYADSTSNVFDDQYAESYAGSIRGPVASRSDEAFLSPFGDDAALTPEIVESRQPSPHLEELQSRNSVLKAPRRSLQNPSYEAGNNGNLLPGNASAISMTRSDDQFDEESGPSHPYGMYPQGLSISRSGSLATTSSRRISSHSSPAHPYGMYTQDGSSDGLADDSGNHIPLGFSGLEQDYRRHFGANGEEEDIIDADGHIEQLPPYTRFDENGAKIAATMLLPAIGSSFTGEAAPQSMTDQSYIQRNQSQTGDGTVPLDIEGSPKAWRDMSFAEWWDVSWREKSRKRFCGISIGIILIVAVSVAVIVAVCGGVIAGFIKKQKANGKNYSQAQGFPPRPTTTTRLIDASAIASPTSTTLPALPTGSYVVDFGYADISQTKCLALNSQYPAWSCQLPGRLVNISIAGSIISVAGTPAHNGSIQYGLQAPVLSPQKLNLAMDKNSPTSGFAYHFQTLYDKLVVVDPKQSSFSKRDAEAEVEPNPFESLEGQRVRPGEQPWFCYWNRTFIEGFIYVQQNSTNSTPPTSVSQNPATTSTTRLLALVKRQIPNLFPTSCSTHSFPRNFVTTGVPEEYPAGAWAGASSNGPSTIPSSRTSATASSLAPATSPHLISASIPASSHLTSTPAVSTSYTFSAYLGILPTTAIPSATSSSSPTGPTTGYPRLMKFQEARVGNQSPSGYCVRMQLLDDGRFVPISDGSGMPITIFLNETDPSYPVYKRGRDTSNLLQRNVAALQDSCFCQWSVGS